MPFLDFSADRLIAPIDLRKQSAFGSGIPSALQRRTQASHAIVLSSGQEIKADMAGYLLLNKNQELPQGRLKEGDVLLQLDGQLVNTIGNVRLALWKKRPDDRRSS